MIPKNICVPYVHVYQRISTIHFLLNIRQPTSSLRIHLINTQNSGRNVTRLLRTPPYHPQPHTVSRSVFSSPASAATATSHLLHALTHQYRCQPLPPCSTFLTFCSTTWYYSNQTLWFLDLELNYKANRFLGSMKGDKLQSEAALR